MTSEKQFEVLATYYLAYADYRLSSLFEDIPEDEKEQYLDSAISHLEKVTEMDLDFAEGWALLGQPPLWDEGNRHDFRHAIRTQIGKCH
ncbi:MAG: hypothetical protein U5K69_22125 [Balneolaceae bacterium]|nr:hypothetical protein [Balneolaceae bacterium]